jgi:hypothetical protein
MRNQWSTRAIVFLSTAMLVMVSAPTAAQAAVAVEGGVFASRGTTAAGGAVSLGLVAVPLTPVRLDLTVAVAGNGAGSAGTLDVRAGTSTTIGAGIGVGNLGATGTTSVIYNALLAQSIAPHTALETRLYFGPQRTSSLFAGLRLSF